MSGLRLGVDIGGTKVAAGLVDNDGVVVARVQRTTPEGAAAIADTVAEVILELMPEVSGALAGIAVPGYVSPDHRSVLYAANLEFENTQLANLLESRLDIDCLVLNDANAALWAEHKFGAARTAQNVAMVTVGTGIGGGLLINGQLVAGANGWAGEIGHMVVDPGGRQCGCGSRGCLDRYASGSSLAQHAETDEDFAEIAYWLGFGLSQVSMLLDPELILLGGGVSAAGNALVRPTQNRLTGLLAEHGREFSPLVRSAELGPDAGLVGAAAYASNFAGISDGHPRRLPDGLVN